MAGVILNDECNYEVERLCALFGQDNVAASLDKMQRFEAPNGATFRCFDCAATWLMTDRGWIRT